MASFLQNEHGRPGSCETSYKPAHGLFEVADRGALFLDEIGTMGLDTQAKILRVLQDRRFMHLGGVSQVQVDVRIIAATNVDLKQQVKEGKFREDLFYRLNVITIDLPPLRQRKNGIPLLVEHFVEKFAAELAVGYCVGNITGNRWQFLRTRDPKPQLLQLLCRLLWDSYARGLAFPNLSFLCSFYYLCQPEKRLAGQRRPLHIYGSRPLPAGIPLHVSAHFSNVYHATRVIALAKQKGASAFGNTEALSQAPGKNAPTLSSGSYAPKSFPNTNTLRHYGAHAHWLHGNPEHTQRCSAGASSRSAEQA